MATKTYGRAQYMRKTFGLTLIVAGFTPSPRQGQLQLLLREADHVLTISPEVISRYLTVKDRNVEVLPGSTLSRVRRRSPLSRRQMRLK